MDIEKTIFFFLKISELLVYRKEEHRQERKSIRLIPKGEKRCAIQLTAGLADL